jgi:2-polyprenyl-3-methyl-5-hydroxy-6-metoxy-1,4-benzoquinol methylase
VREVHLERLISWILLNFRKDIWSRIHSLIKRSVMLLALGLLWFPARVFHWLSFKFSKHVWPRFPEPLRRQLRILRTRRALGLKIFERIPVLGLLERRYHQVVEGTAPAMHGHEIELSTPEHADEMIKWSLLAQKNEGDSGLQAYMTGFKYRFPSPPKDPFSKEYSDFWMAQYETMARKKYAIENELHDFDLASLRQTPHPYNTRDQKMIAAHIIAAGVILETIAAPPPAKVLEMGVGFGNTALQIGLSGYDVTVLDIEKKHLEIVAERFEREGLSVRCLHMQFMDIENMDDRFDAIIFYECFHHCIDHRQLLLILREKLVPGGVIIFAGETINELLPYAWGLNPTGQGIWSIRHHGWMELVFKESYFAELLRRAGFLVSQNNHPHSANSRVFTARLKS